MSDVTTKLGIDYNPQGAKQFIVDVQQGKTAAESLTEALKEDTAASTENAEAHEKVSTSMGNTNASSRALRIGMAGLLADMALASVAAGSTLPQGMQEAAKSLQTVIDLAVAGNFALPGLGFALGAVAGSALALGTAATTVAPMISDLDKKLDSLSKQDELTNTLSQLLGVTDKTAASMLTAAGHSSTYAKELDAVLKAAQPVSPFIAAIGSAVDSLTGSTKGFDAVGEFFNGILTTAGQAAELFAGTLAADISLIKDLASGTSLVQARTDANNAFNASMRGMLSATAGVTPPLKELNALASEATTINNQYDPSIKRIDSSLQSLAKTLRDDVAGQLQEMSRLETQVTSDTANNALEMERITQTRNDALFQANQSLRDKETDAAYQYAASLEQINEEIVRQHQAMVDRIADIDFQNQQSQMSLDFNLKEQLETAKTQREREEIMERYRFEAGQLQARTAHEKSDAQRSYDEAKQAAAQKQALADQTYQHQLDLDQRTYKEQTALARKRYDEEKTALKERYQLEIENINNSLAAFLTAEDLKIQAMQNEIRVEQGLATLPYAIHPPDPNLLNQLSQYEQQNAPHYGIGGVVPGPKGSPQLIMAHGGETIVREGKTKSTASDDSPMYVNVSVEPMLRPAIQSIFEQMTAGRVFKKQVKLIFNDAAAGQR